jgi:hypothetical protein
MAAAPAATAAVTADASEAEDGGVKEEDTMLEYVVYVRVTPEL